MDPLSDSNKIQCIDALDLMKNTRHALVFVGQAIWNSLVFVFIHLTRSKLLIG